MLQISLTFLLNIISYIAGNNVSLIASDEEKKAKYYASELKPIFLAVSTTLLFYNIDYFFLLIILFYPLFILLNRHKIIIPLVLAITLYFFNLTSILLVIIASYLDGLQNSNINKKSIKLDKTIIYQNLIFLIILLVINLF